MAPATSTASTTTRRPRGLVLLGLVIALFTALAASLVGASPVHAADGDGWVRVGHLSPDTKSVDVTLTSVSGGQVVMDLDDVTYGQVSPYQALPAGTYVVSMTSNGAGASAVPVISTNVTVKSGEPITVVAYGPAKSIKTQVFNDDLTAPADGQAKIRLVQAANVSKTVTVATTTGTTIAEKAAFGSASGYASVAAGPWSLKLTGTSVNGTADVNLAAGSITTLFVLDNSTGGLTVVPVVDSAATAATPVGGVQTGGGYLAEHPGADQEAQTATPSGFWGPLLGLLGLTR
ncbi:DUF4397 domain-containing protein [Frigoribacterium sp. 2-23]|uniref:DUF4397 domain-containing protein n=1 Tax=Frigoribacterium sp. 2-23 TaxID=3415006 RepID=UPI003C6EC4F4